ncbi:phosphoribosylformylglycinamidine synthase subunit PurQ [Paracoccus sp. MC1854]|uniref:phosphoribosylformylglycinamidine synthase subunit PurQ n=1 Tax=Paracoccus sp. MC1854 TaxID=2760306 RepID=UPI001601FB1F|nr:phosphoribosylformylglycinamidine synthase subunit PurQ [Paracoccus sp. MC1854]MBB1491573.1 phosphoribosylformylglycinamidine synthase subunit PurQ [Paracoccus sp. MC1854]
MRAAVITFPGSNCDRDLLVALKSAGAGVSRVWHKDDALPEGTDLVAVPGGFSFGDYLRCGAIAARSPVAAAIRTHAERGGYVLGVCNGFQVLTELGLLPGALMRNAGLTFLCKDAPLRVTARDNPFLSAFSDAEEISLPIAHHDGNYQIDAEGLTRLKAEGRIALTYRAPVNGSVADIAGVLSENRRVLGMMPHPERAAEAAHGGSDGARLFHGLIDSTVAA